MNIKNNQKLLTLSLLVLLLFSTVGSAMAATGEAAAAEADQEKQTVLKDSMDKINYSVGFQIGNDFQNQRVELRTDSMMRGIMDATQNNKPLLTKGEMKAQLIDLKEGFSRKRPRTLKNTAVKTGTSWPRTQPRKGVTLLDSGLQYKVVTPGDGATPKETDMVKSTISAPRSTAANSAAPTARVNLPSFPCRRWFPASGRPCC